MRMRLIVTMVLACALLGCGLFEGGRGAAESDDEVSVAPPSAAPPSGMVAPISYLGPSSLESRILKSPVIARVRLDSVSTTAESGPTYQGMEYSALLEFSFSVQEYLKGGGADDIVAVWAAEPLFDGRQEAEAALPAIAAARDTQWDDREAIVFLQHSETTLASTQQADRYYLAWGGSWSIPDDGYSIASIHDKLWLPAEAAVGAPSQPGGDQQRFLMDVPPTMKTDGRIVGTLPDGTLVLDGPPATRTAPTITLGELKTRIAAVAAKLDAGDGSEEYAECVSRTFLYERINQYQISTGDEGFFYRTPDQELDSGLAASIVVYETTAYGDLPNERAEVWLDGGDGDLFNVEFSDGVPHDFSGDGTNDSIQYAQRVASARPLPAGVYSTHYNHRDAVFVPCDGYTFRHDWTVTVNAPDGVLHELFYDPVTVGSAVGAGSANGVLKPASFTGANGATTTIDRIAWEPGSGATGTVKVALSPHTGISGHAVDFIELDGSVSLSLNVADAAVDAANNTLSWPVVSQPRRSGNKLMVRIREAPDCSTGAVPDTSANPGLARDCEILLVVMDTLRGTATLNWNTTTTITAWDGVTVSGAPSRVTRLELANEGLDGSIPEYLGRLLGLTHLNLSRNSLTGHIPAELGGLSNLEALRLSGNNLTGCIPVALMTVATNDLSSLDLLYCRPPAPENLIAGTSTATSIPLSWNAVAGAVSYRVEYGPSISSDWTVDIANATATSHVVDDLDCGTDYRFRVSAFDVGTVYAAGWSEPSEPASGTTGACNRTH